MGAGGEREIDLDGFFVDMLTTSLQEREIIREVRLKAQAPGTGAAYLKFDQPASHYALTGVCAVVTLGAAAPSPRRASASPASGPRPTDRRPWSRRCRASRPTKSRSARRWQSVADGIDVQGDIHAGPEYRAHLARVFTRRAVLLAAASEAKG